MANYRTILIVTLALLSNSVIAAEVVHHTVSFPEDRQQTILVRSEIPVSAGLTELMMPIWTPGSYLVRDFAANVNQISVFTGDGTRLAVRKSSKDRWQVNTGRDGMLIVEYVIFTPDLNVSTSWADSTFSLINGASVFLYTVTTRDLPQQLDIVLSPERGEAFTAMPTSPAGTGYRAKNYDELVDNPVVVANAPAYRFRVKKQDYVLLNVLVKDVRM